jgi:predicted ATPase
MISHLALKNFKSLKEADLDLRKLNILVGPNNTGKSSVLHALAFLAQNSEEPKLHLNERYVNLGKLRDVSFKGEDIIITFRIKFDEDEGKRTREIFNLTPFSDFDFSEITSYIRVPIDKNIEEGLIDFLITEISDRNEIIFARNESEVYIHEVLKKDISSVSSGIMLRPDGGRSETIEAYGEFEKIIRRKFDENFFYLKALRGTEEREKNISSKPPKSVGLHGELLADVLAYIRDDPKYEISKEKIRNWGIKFGFKNIIPKLIESPSYAINLTDERLGVQSNIVDIGFGTNQILSVIVQCFCAPKGSFIMVEEPEIHLHPRNQAELADLFVDVVDYGHQLIIETHSMHILLRLQRRIAEGKISPDDIAIYSFYFDEQEKSNKTERIELDEVGRFKKKIPGFFEDELEDMWEHSRAVMERSKRKEKNE